MHSRTLTPPRISRRSADSREIVPRPGDHAGNTSLLDHLISKNSPRIATTSNTLIVTCAIVILIAVLVFLELHIRRSIVHLHPTGAETRTDSPREPKQPKRMSAAREAVLFSFSNWLMPNEMKSQRNLTAEQIQSRAVNGEGP